MEFRDDLRPMRKGPILIRAVTPTKVAVASISAILTTSDYQFINKVFVSLQTAATGSELSVRLVDADLPKPRSAENLGIEGDSGLTDVIVGPAKLKARPQRWGAHNVCVLPSRHISADPKELLFLTAKLMPIQTPELQFDLVLRDGHFKGSVSALKTVGSVVAGTLPALLSTKGPNSYGQGGYPHAYGCGYGEAPDFLTKSVLRSTHKRFFRTSGLLREGVDLVAVKLGESCLSASRADQTYRV